MQGNLPLPSLDYCTLPHVAVWAVDPLERISGWKTALFLFHAQTVSQSQPSARRYSPFLIISTTVIVTSYPSPYHALRRQKRSYPNWLPDEATGTPAPTIDAQKKQCHHTPQLPRLQSARCLVRRVLRPCRKMLSRKPRLRHGRPITPKLEVQDRILPPNEPQSGQCCVRRSSKTTPQPIQ
jgi:hypothetical protein